MPLDGLGRVAVGGEASFVVLDRDVFSVESQALDQVRVAQTWLAGERVYARTQGAAVMAKTPGQSSGGSAPAV
jgi:cytosine/adenosine deaminase-related metal-dependent hydrolase